MVLPAPAADAGAAEAQAWLGKLIRDLGLAQRGILFALVDATPTQLGPVVRALSEVPPWACEDEGVLEVCLRGPDLVRLRPGGRVLLRVREEDLEWLNVFRPIFSDLELRAILWAEARAFDAMVRHAADLVSWISRDVPVPVKRLPDFAVQGVCAALDSGVSFCWRGPGLEGALAAAAWREGSLELRVDMSHRELSKQLRAPGLPIVTGIRSERDAWRVRMALARAGRTGSWVAREPEIRLSGMWHLHAEQADWEQAAEQLRAAGWRRPELMAAWVDLELEAIAAAIERVEEPPREPGEFGAEAIIRAEVPARVLRARIGAEDVVAARERTRRGEPPVDDAGRVCWSEGREAWAPGDAVEARLVRALRNLGNELPSEVLVESSASANFVDVAMDLAQIRWEAGADSRADQLVAWLMQRGQVETAKSIAEEWQARAEEANDDCSRANAKTWLGDIDLILVKGEDAMHHYEDALALGRQLVEREPGRLDFQRGLAVSHERLGDVDCAFGRHEVALHHFNDSLAITRQLVEREPGRLDLRRDLSVIYSQLGDVQGILGHGELALHYFEEALAITRQLVEHDPGGSDLRRNLASIYSRLGDAQGVAGNGKIARSYFEDSLAITRDLVESEPDRTDLKRDLSFAYIKVGDVQGALGNAEHALRHYERSLAITRQLVEREPIRLDLQQDLAIAFERLGDSHRSLGNGDLARRHYEDSFAIRKRLVERDPDRSDLQRDLSVALDNLGDCHRVLGDAESALRFHEDSLAVRKRLIEREPARFDLLRGLSVSYDRMGDIHRALGSTELAIHYYEDSLALAQNLMAREPGRYDLLRDLATSFERMALVKPADAADWLARAVEIRRTACDRDPTNAMIRRELAFGLVQFGVAMKREDSLREGYEILRELRANGALEAEYHAVVDQLAPHVADPPA